MGGPSITEASVLPHVDLIAKLNRTRERPDYDIFAGEQLVGRIYLMHVTSTNESWWWGLNSICLDATIPGMMKGYTQSLEKAQASFRAAFDVWLAWATAMPTWDLKQRQIGPQLKKIGVQASA
jgi:hypothetical protein